MPWGRSAYVFKVVSVVLVFFWVQVRKRTPSTEAIDFEIASEVWSIGCKMIF